jgi:hypothetical protein
MEPREPRGDLEANDDIVSMELSRDPRSRGDLEMRGDLRPREEALSSVGGGDCSFSLPLLLSLGES